MVDTSGALRRGHPITFGFVCFISLIVAIIASALTADYNNHGSQTGHLTGSVRYLLFVGWQNFCLSIAFGVLFLLGKGGVFTSVAGHFIALFWMFLTQLAGAGTITDAIGGDPNCSHSALRYCRSLQALAAFSWIATVVLFIMLIIVGVVGAGAFRGGRSAKETLGA